MSSKGDSDRVLQSVQTQKRRPCQRHLIQDSHVHLPPLPFPIRDAMRHARRAGFPKTPPPQASGKPMLLRPHRGVVSPPTLRELLFRHGNLLRK